MTAEERHWLNHICTLIQHEEDAQKFSALIRELNEFLESREKGLPEQWKKEPF